MLPSNALVPTLPLGTSSAGTAQCMEGVDPLIRKAQDGDAAAFARLFRAHRPEVTRLVFRLLGASADVEDVVQDVFVHVYRSLPSFRGESKLSTWLYRLTVNVVRMHLRRGRSRPRFADVPLPDPPDGDGAFSERPDGAVERAERLRAFHRAVALLSEKKRTVLVLHDLEGLSAKEISDIVGAPVLTVRTRLFYARKELYSAFAAEPALAALVDALADDLPGRPEPAREGAAETPAAARTAAPRARPATEGGE